ncbi:hypothetical protein FIU93_15270 [Labrenzia sp. THAF35]|nr:hypothetical protein FIU93_15270 [Labrenzia sp. THAF35]
MASSKFVMLCYYISNLYFIAGDQGNRFLSQGDRGSLTAEQWKGISGSRSGALISRPVCEAGDQEAREDELFQKGSGALSVTSFMTKNVRVCRTPGNAISFSPCSLLKSAMSRVRIFRK